jgi:transcriptional regulator
MVSFLNLDKAACMYNPHPYRIEDRQTLLSFMRAHNFASLVSTGETGIVATHLPFVIAEHQGQIMLRSHMAKANPHWKLFAADRESLVIFQGPHAYISPAFYDSPVNVPTWNYAAVHAYGLPRLLTGSETDSVLAAMMDSFEADYRRQYGELPDDFKRKMLNGIVGFEMAAARLEGKHKLSQNKTVGEQTRIAEALSADPDQAAAETGRMMQDNLNRV